MSRDYTDTLIEDTLNEYGYYDHAKASRDKFWNEAKEGKLNYSAFKDGYKDIVFDGLPYYLKDDSIARKLTKFDFTNDWDTVEGKLKNKGVYSHIKEAKDFYTSEIERLEKKLEEPGVDKVNMESVISRYKWYLSEVKALSKFWGLQFIDGLRSDLEIYREEKAKKDAEEDAEDKRVSDAKRAEYEADKAKYAAQDEEIRKTAARLSNLAKDPKIKDTIETLFTKEITKLENEYRPKYIAKWSEVEEFFKELKQTRPYVDIYVDVDGEIDRAKNNIKYFNLTKLKLNIDVLGADRAYYTWDRKRYSHKKFKGYYQNQGPNDWDETIEYLVLEPAKYRVNFKSIIGDSSIYSEARNFTISIECFDKESDKYDPSLSSFMAKLKAMAEATLDQCSYPINNFKHNSYYTDHLEILDKALARSKEIQKEADRDPNSKIVIDYAAEIVDDITNGGSRASAAWSSWAGSTDGSQGAAEAAERHEAMQTILPKLAYCNWMLINDAHDSIAMGVAGMPINELYKEISEMLDNYNSNMLLEILPSKGADDDELDAEIAKYEALDSKDFSDELVNEYYKN